MATALHPTVQAEQCVILQGVSWETYERLLTDFADSHAAYFAYDQGMLEIRVPSFTHEQLNRLIHDLFTAIAVEMHVEFLNAGSTTFKREGLRRGFEPDTCFYVQNVERVWGKTQLDLAVDPPPDVVVEIDITHPSLDKLPIYAAVGVPEIWRYNGQALTLLKLEDGTYQAQAESTALPGVGGQILSQLLEEGKVMKRTEWLRRVHAWALTQWSV